ncbi:MAG: FCD domain-containing protein [Solirubrobacterales bacterium]
MRTLQGPIPSSATWELDTGVSTATAALGASTAAPPTAAERADRACRLVRLTSQTSQLCERNAPARQPGGDISEGATGAERDPRADRRRASEPSGRQRSAAHRRGAGPERLPKTAGILGEEGAPPSREVPAAATALCDRIRDAVSSVFPGQWRRLGGDEDIDRVEAQLLRMEQAAERGDLGAADQARREAYAIFEMGPEPRLRAFAPDLVVRLESLFWAAAADGPNLVDVLSGHSSMAMVRERRLATVAALEQARAALDRPRSAGAVVTNSAIVVFREGLEAALILAALAATFAAGGRAWRRPLVIGMLAAVPATMLTWLLTSQVVSSLSGFGLALEAVLDIAALVVLVIILAWFFRRFCWTRFVAGQHARHRRLLGLGRSAGPALAVGLLGFTAIYREGFETVVYLQALKLDAGGTTVLQGVLLGLALTGVLALLMLRLRRRLPYRAIVVAAAAGIALLTVILAGQAARAAQAAGWLGVDPLDLHFPAWAGQWFGLYPATQTLAVQALAAAGVSFSACSSATAASSAPPGACSSPGRAGRRPRPRRRPGDRIAGAAAAIRRPWRAAWRARRWAADLPGPAAGRCMMNPCAWQVRRRGRTAPPRRCPRAVVGAGVSLFSPARSRTGARRPGLLAYRAGRRGAGAESVTRSRRLGSTGAGSRCRSGDVSGRRPRADMRRRPDRGPCTTRSAGRRTARTTARAGGRVLDPDGSVASAA